MKIHHETSFVFESNALPVEPLYDHLHAAFRYLPSLVRDPSGKTARRVLLTLQVGLPVDVVMYNLLMTAYKKKRCGSRP